MPRRRADRELAALRTEAEGCVACPLHLRATQTVFGEGPGSARLVLVGEQPGDQEDRVGAPFVGPAGRLLDEALEAAGIARDDVYLTNAVKHFKWEERGARRIHKKPNRGEIRACHPWLESEVAAVAPELVVAMGATATFALVGDDAKVTRDRGRVVTGEDDERPAVLVTVHPSAVLRSRTRSDDMARFVDDLRVAPAWLSDSA